LGKTLDFIDGADFFDQSVSFFTGNLGVESLEIGTVLEFVVQQSDQIVDWEDCFDFVEERSETSFLIGVGSGSGTSDEIVDPGDNVVNGETSVVQILDELLDFGFGTDGVDEFCPFRSLEVEHNSSESAISLEMFVGDSFDVVKRKEVNEVLQIVSQSPGRFLVIGSTETKSEDRKKNNEQLHLVVG
jgi:hypothetical protein